MRKAIESKLINLNKKYYHWFIIIQGVVGQTKINNFMDKNLNDFFSFVSNKIIFILLVAILYFQIYKHYIYYI